MKALILLRDIYSIVSLTDNESWSYYIYSIMSLTLIMKALILLRDIYSIISLTDNESFDLTEGY